MDMPLNEIEIAEYLAQNPDFFATHTDLLATMYLPNPHGSGTVSLAERQQVAQRDKIRQVERKYNELLQFGIENDSTSTKVHQLTLALLKANDLNSTVQALNDSLKNDFNVPFASLHLWAAPRLAEDAENTAFKTLDESIQSWADNLIEPYCGTTPVEAITHIHEVENASYAITVLGDGQLTGLLIMASDDEKRFYPEMGTMFVKRIGELATAATQKYLA